MSRIREVKCSRIKNILEKFIKSEKIRNIIIILIIFITILGRKTIILLSLSEKAKENQSYDNYYIKLNSYQGDYFITTEIYNKGEDYLRTWTKFSTDTQEIQKMIYYKKGNDQILLQEIGENKYIKKSFIEGQIYPVTYIPTNLKDKIESIIFLNINSTYFSVISTSCNGKKCYLIKDKNNESYIDKETGMAVRHIEKNNENDLVIDYDYKFNIVTDNDIKKPDITGYIIEE